MTTIDACLADGEPPLLWVAELAARLQGEPVPELYEDPAVISRSLAQAADLFDLPAVCPSFDSTVEAEAAGCAVEWDDDRPVVVGGCIETIDDTFDIDLDGIADRGRVPIMTEATARLVETVDTASVLGGVTGPRTLTDHLLVDGTEASNRELVEETRFTAGDMVVEVANAYLDAGVDGISVLEPDGASGGLEYADAITPLVNVIEHYDRTAVLVTAETSPTGIRTAADLGFDGITGAVDDPGEAHRTGEEAGIRVGVGIPPDVFLDGPTGVRTFADSVPGDALLSSGWTVPLATEPDAVHELMGSLA